MRLFLAFRAFFKILFSAAVATQVREMFDGGAAPAVEEEKPVVAAKPKKKEPPAPKRNDAVTLLATLQREARFVDICREPLAEYSDDQIGAAARDVLRDCGEVLDRLFGLKAIVDEEEDAEIEAPAGYDAGRYRLTGKVEGEPPFLGRLAHHGWEAGKCELPKWSGSKDSVMVVAPVEIEVG